MARSRKRYSYIKRKLATGTWQAAASAAASFLCLLFCIGFSVAHQGEGPLVIGALGLFSLLLSVMALWFAAAGLRQQERNRLGVRIAGISSSLVTFTWLVLIFVGIRLG